MQHSSDYKPKVFPYLGDVSPAEIDRAQAIDPRGNLNREEIEEIGRDGKVGSVKKASSVTYRMTQLEYGSVELWQKLVNSATLGAIGETEIALKDFKTPTFDICAYMTGDDEVFKGTVHYPKLRTSGFSIGIGDPDATVERTFDFVGEKAITWQGDNKYFIYLRKACGSGETGDVDIVIGSGDFTDYPDPVKDPDENAGDDSDYFVRILRVRGTATTELELTDDYTYVSGTTTITVKDSEVGDVIKVYYTASSYISGAEPFVLNDSDPAALAADTVSIYLGVGNYVYRLQSITLDVTFDREDIKEVGNSEVVARGVRDKTVTVTLGRILEKRTIEEILRGKSTDYGKLDIDKFGDDLTLVVKIYEDNTKSAFKLGLKATGLSATEVRAGVGINAYVTEDNSLEGEALIITADESKL